MLPYFVIYQCKYQKCLKIIYCNNIVVETGLQNYILSKLNAQFQIVQERISQFLQFIT